MILLISCTRFTFSFVGLFFLLSSLVFFGKVDSLTVLQHQSTMSENEQPAVDAIATVIQIRISLYPVFVSYAQVNFY